MGSVMVEKLNADLKQAMKAREQLKVSVLRLLLNAIHNTEMARQAELNEGDILGVLAKEIKQRNESIEAFSKGNRQDLAAKEEAEKAILSTYMPQQLTRDEVTAEARKAIAEVGASGPGDKGKVMQKLVPVLKGKAEGKLINEVVTELLSA